MYLNNFRRNHANGLESCKIVDIVEKKEANKRASGVDLHSSEEHAKSKTLATSKKIRGASQSNTQVP